MRHTRCALALLSALFLLASVAANADVPTVTPSIDAAEGAALQWITRQMVPNGTVPDPSADRRRLLISYEVPNSDPAYRYIYGRSFIYDDALGVVALTMRGRYREAELLLNGLTRLVRGDGSLWFAYNTQNDWPSETDNGGAMIRTGSVAWVGYALTYYLTVRSQSQPDFATADLLGRQYRDAAQSIGRFVMSRRVTGSGDPREGLVTGGTGSSVVTIAGSGAAPAEVYDASPLGWVSTEHNIDAWFLLRDLGRLTGDAVWAGAARHLQDRLLTLWSVGDGQFYQDSRHACHRHIPSARWRVVGSALSCRCRQARGRRTRRFGHGGALRLRGRGGARLSPVLRRAGVCGPPGERLLLPEEQWAALERSPVRLGRRLSWGGGGPRACRQT